MRFMTLSEFEELDIESGIYILSLDNGKYYIGKSQSIKERVRDHSTEWTDKYTPHSVDKIYPATEDLSQLEKDITILYMLKYGWRNVRGYAWCATDLENPPTYISANS